MPLVLRRHVVVDHNHVITLQAPELRPGDQVEVIVLVERDIEAENKNPDAVNWPTDIRLSGVAVAKIPLWPPGRRAPPPGKPPSRFTTTR